MPAPASEDDLKRRARRRLIGAVALTLAAVIVLPLMLEDEPPPAAQLEVHMPASGKTPDFVPITPAPAPVTVTPPMTPAPPSVAESPNPPEPDAEVPTKKVAVEKPKPAVAAEVKKPSKPNPPLEDEPKTAVEKSAAFVVQLGAFSEASKTEDLKQQVDQLGMSSYTDKIGALTRLRVGPFPSRQAAVEAAARLAEAGVDGQVMPK